jgi:spore coat protein U-like protein
MRFIALILGVGLMAASGAAVAQSATYNLNAQVQQICGAYNTEGQVVPVDFGALANTLPAQFVQRSAGDITYRCNVAAGFTRTVRSQNNGWMTLSGQATTSVNRRIRFTMQHQGANGFGYVQLTAPRVNSLRDPVGNPLYLRGQTAIIRFRAFGVRGAATTVGPVGTTVFAGNYRDTVTLTITAN